MAQILQIEWYYHFRHLLLFIDTLWDKLSKILKDKIWNFSCAMYLQLNLNKQDSIKLIFEVGLLDS